MEPQTLKIVGIAAIFQIYHKIITGTRFVFPKLSETALEKALARYLALGIWNQTPYLEREGFERLRESCLSGGLIRKGIPYEAGVDMRFAEAAIEEDPPPMV